MIQKILLTITIISLHACASLSQTDSSENVEEFELQFKDGKFIRTERFKNSGGIRAKGEVKAECGGAKCTPAQAEKFAPAKIKSLVKHGAWEEYLQFEQEGSTPENKKFKSILDSYGEFLDGKKVGIWKKPDPDSPNRTLAEVPWVDGKKEGVAKSYDKSGNLISETEFSDDKRNGRYWKKTTKGEWLEKGTYKDNEEEGEWTFYFTGIDGNGVKTVVSFQKGQKQGSETNYYKDGKIESQGNYQNGARSGQWKLYGGLGNLLAEGPYSAKEGVSADAEIKHERTGIWKEYYANGALFGTGQRKHTRTGNWKFYYNNGQVAYDGIMANESMFESAKIFDREGKILGDGKLFFSLIKIDETSGDLKLNYKPSIPFIYFYPSGKKRMVIRDKDDATEFSENGKELGKGPVDPSGRKMGCWIIEGKKEYYMLDAPKPKLTATQCQ
ncbi:MORN repeat protein [Leptospira ryugenii]|uniref:MORN repeat protein n=1 Tax=Leptospira ryugenii TaxID=1917863 RepID=A0A2P2E4X7_9LEPT|nr:LIC20035 family adhesin [Leptospira ryugenii]GBF51916.1 MORN repeat protein [Leptospira ryugenii]